MAKIDISSAKVKEIKEVLLNFCRCDFSKKIEISDLRDNFIDAISQSINMVGEELEATVVNRDFFEKIYDQVDSLILITNLEGKIISGNYSSKQLNESFFYNEIFIQNILKFNNTKIEKIIKVRNKNKINFSGEAELFVNNKKYNVLVKISPINISGKTDRLLFTLSDITELKQKEKESITLIINAQEGERNRLAQDLHDDMGQQISGLKMYVQVMENLSSENDQFNELAKKSLEILDSIADELRRVCFNLMPRTLHESGLKNAIEAHIQRLSGNSAIQFSLKLQNTPKQYSKEFEVNIFRIVQEFITNSLKYSKCSKINIALKFDIVGFELKIKDNGIGFNLKTKSSGYGLKNIETRSNFIHAYHRWTSKQGEGTELKIWGTPA